MAQLTLTVIGNVDDVNKKIDALRTNLQQNPIKIRIDASGADAVTKDLIEYAKWTAKATSAEADLEKQRAKTATATARQAEAEAKATAQREQTNRAAEATRQQEERTRRQIEETNTERQRQITVARQVALEYQRQQTEAARLETQEERTRTQTERLAIAQTNLERAMLNAANRADVLGQILRRIEMRAINAAINAVTNSLRDALQTLRDVDDELVTIRKVTGFSGEQIDAIKKQAFEIASAYGETADAYLKSVAAFSRAGYKEQSAELAELATKTQIVGDTTGETANQFLLSVDKAYKFQGSIEELSKVLDGANEIDNKYATSIEKIASGMGIVAPVASQMHVQVNELAAAIGTITAVTQRSGTEAARALRALFLNIAGDTKTEIDEGITWTTGEIEGLRDVIKMYAKDAYDAAQATGKIIDPMKAMEGLAKSMAEGVLTEQKLIEMVSDIGGKLRTSQLLAIIQNWDMYQSMLQDYAGAIGSADKEVNNALDSWTRKTNQLKNAWAEFISHQIDSKEIKAGLDFLIGAVNFLDSGFGRAAVKAGMFFAALRATNTISGLTALISGLITTIGGLTTATELFNVVWSQSPFVVVAIGVAAIYGLVKAVDALNVTYKEQKEILEQLNSEYEKQFGAGSEYEELKSKVDDLTVSERERLIVLEGQRKALAKQVEEASKLASQKWLSENSRNTVLTPNINENGDFYYSTSKTYEKNLNDLTTAIDKASDAYFNLEYGIDGYTNALSKSIAPFKSYYDGLIAARDSGEKLNDEELEFIRVYENAIGVIGRHEIAIQADTEAKDDNKRATDELSEAEKALKTAFEEVESNSSLTYGTLEELDKLYPGLSKKILDANGNLSAEGQAALSTKAAFVELIAQMISFNNSGLDVSGKILALQELEWQALGTGAAVKYAISAADVKSAADAYVEIGYSRDEAEAQVYRDYENSWNQRVLGGLKDKQYIPTVTTNGGGGSRQQTEEEKLAQAQKEELNRRKQVVSDEKAKYELMVAQGKSAAELSAQADLIQQKLHDQAEYMREIKEPYANVAALSKEWWDWEKKKTDLIDDEQEKELKGHKDKVASLKSELSFLEESGAAEEEIIAKQREIQAALHAQAEYMRSIKADENDIRALSTEWWQIQNKILDTTEKLAQKLRDDIADTLGEIADSLKSAAEAATKPLQDELDALTAAHDVTEDRREEEEKILAVEKARIELENAQRERTVRQYNAVTGQWEWVANAKNVEEAQKKLVDAETDLEKYRAEQQYEAQKENLEKQIKSTNSAFDALGNAIKEAAQAVKDGKMSFEEAYAYIKLSMQSIYDQYGIDLTATLQEAGGKLVQGITALFEDERISEAVKNKAISAMGKIMSDAENAADSLSLFSDYILTALETDNPADAIAELSDAIKSGVVTDLNDVAQILKALNGEYSGISTQTARVWALTKMQANSVAWHLTDDQATRNALHAENVQLGESMGLTYNSRAGTWNDASGNQVYTLSNIGGDWTSTLNTALQSVIDLINGAANNAKGNTTSSGSTSGGTSVGSASYSGSTSTSTGTTTSKVAKVQANGKAPAGLSVGDQVVTGGGTFVITGVNADGSYQSQKVPGGATTATYKGKYDVYDSGGLLHGEGAIKATSQDEMVLPPDMTSKLLTAEANGAFDALLSHLGIVTAAANSYNSISAGRSSQSIGSQHNGDVYEIGGVTLSESKAKSMTVYELAQMGRALALHTGS